jgi:hypothetical protein
VGPPLSRLGAQRGLSGLGHPRGLDRPAGDGQTCLAPGGGRLLRQGRQAVPRSWTVLGLAERGLDARWLGRRLTRLGGQPLLRLNPGGTLRPTGQGRGVPLKTWVPEPGTTWQGTGLACTGRHRPLPWTRLACWEAGETAPGLIRTDLLPEARTACWDGWRAWLEQGVKSTKRAGWQWQRPPHDEA